MVRESITAWRDEALAGFVSQPVTTKSNRKSALAALRQFFDLSPLWLKAATAFAVVVFGVLAAMAFVNLQRDKVQVSSTTTTPEATYTQQEVDHLIQQALLKEKSTQQPQIYVDVEKSSKPKKSRNSADAQFAKSRRPLSKAEREQLAADLRLLSTDDDESLNLIGDRINQ